MNNFCLAAETTPGKSYEGGKFKRATEVSSETDGRFVFAGDFLDSEAMSVTRDSSQTGKITKIWQ